MSAERCDYYSDEEYQHSLQQEKEQQQEQAEQDHYQEMLHQLEYIARDLGRDHAISYLQAIKEIKPTRVQKMLEL